MKLIHGTNWRTANTALDEGYLTPRGRRRGNWFTSGKARSIPSAVYLTNNERSVLFYATRAAVIAGDPDMALVTVDVDETSLIPDENLFVDIGTPLTKDQMNLAKKQAIRAPDKWAESLAKNGLVAHVGPAPVVDIQPLGPWREGRLGWLAEETGTLKEFERKFDTMVINRRDPFNWKLTPCDDDHYFIEVNNWKD